MKTVVVITVLFLVTVYSCRKDSPAQPQAPSPAAIDYRDSVTGTYNCSQYCLFYMSPDTLLDTTYLNKPLVITKDSLNASNIVINHSVSVLLNSTDYSVPYDEPSAMNGGSYYGRFFPANDSVSFSMEFHSMASHSHCDWHGTK